MQFDMGNTRRYLQAAGDLLAVPGSARCGADATDRNLRIVVVGTTGCGKTTVARQLAQLFGIPHVELDALNWEPNWTTAPTDLFRQRVEGSLKGDGWVVDGNYSAVRDIVWPRATTLVWLDYHLWVIMWRLVSRTFRRTVTREELWNDNRERFLDQFLSRDSLFLWALRTYRMRRRTYPLLLSRPEYAHLRVVHLRSPGETREWLSRLETAFDCGSVLA